MSMEKKNFLSREFLRPAFFILLGISILGIAISGDSGIFMAAGMSYAGLALSDLARSKQD